MDKNKEYYKKLLEEAIENDTLLDDDVIEEIEDFLEKEKQRELLQNLKDKEDTTEVEEPKEDNTQEGEQPKDTTNEDNTEGEEPNEEQPQDTQDNEQDGEDDKDKKIKEQVILIL